MSIAVVDTMASSVKLRSGRRGALAATVTVMTLPGLIVPRSQSIWLAFLPFVAKVQVPAVGVTDSNIPPLPLLWLSAALRAEAVASFEPWLVMTTVYVTWESG